MTDAAPAEPARRRVRPPGGPPPGRLPPLEPDVANRLFREGVSLFNGLRFWHAHEAWEALWRSAPDDERPFYQGLIQVAAGYLHLQRRNARGARTKLAEGRDKLRAYAPAHHGIVINDLLARVAEALDVLDTGRLPRPIPPTIRWTR